jgi:hypothetical protein
MATPLFSLAVAMGTAGRNPCTGWFSLALGALALLSMALMSSTLSASAELLSPEAVAARLHVSTARLASWRTKRRGCGPPFLRLGKTVLYRAADVEAWLRQQTRDPAGVEELGHA